MSQEKLFILSLLVFFLIPEISHPLSFLYLSLTIPLFPLCGHHSLPILSEAEFVLWIKNHVGLPFIALHRLFYLSDRRPPVLFRVISALLQITLPPVWGSDPSQGSPLNLILIITSVINRHGLEGDYSARPIPLFPLSTALAVGPRAVIPVSIWGRQILSSVPLKIWWL